MTDTIQRGDRVRIKRAYSNRAHIVVREGTGIARSWLGLACGSCYGTEHLVRCDDTARLCKQCERWLSVRDAGAA